MNKAVADHSSSAEQPDAYPTGAVDPEAEADNAEMGANFGELTGRQLGAYVLDVRLGGGAMAIVYRAIDLNSKQPVALKLLNPSADAVLRERFRVEARTVRTLDHPHIVRTLSSGQSDDGITYMAMEMVEGDSLSTLLEQRHKISVLDACRLLAPIVRALAHAHEKGIVHRDVKPSNILLRRVPVGTAASVPIADADYAVIPLLSDFGIARALDAPELTSAGRTIGTPAYMSPEQCAGTRELDGRADIYSMGAVLYRCLVGRPPFVGATTQILHAHVYESLTIPEVVAKALPGTILDILRRALQKEPAARYDAAALLANDLDLLISQATGRTKTVADSTLTMPILFAASTGLENVATQVLVAGVGNAPARPLIPWVPPAAATTKSTIHSVPDNRRVSRRTNWLVIVVGILVSAALVGLGALAITTILPFTTRDNVAASDPPTPVRVVPTLAPSVVVSTAPSVTPPTPNLSAGTDSVGIMSTGKLTGTADRAASNGISATAALWITATAGLTQTQGVSQSEGISATEPTSATGTISNPNTTLDVATTWGDVQHYLRIGDWGRARFFLIDILVFAGQIESLGRGGLTPPIQARLAHEGMMGLPDDRFWSTWQAVFTRDELQRTLADSYIGSANLQIQASKLLTATYYLDAATVVQPTNELVASLAAATSDYFNTTAVLKVAATDNLSEAYTAYARDRAAAGAYCAAFDALLAVTGLTANASAGTELATYQTECEQIQGRSAGASPQEAPIGQIIYSTQEGSDYRIYRTLVPTTTVTVLVVDGGTQPSVSGSALAFYSRRPGADGLSGINWLSGRAPTDSFNRYTGAIEDAAESPPRWNAKTNQLVFSSKSQDDPKARIFVTDANFANNSRRELGRGEDPAWSPDGTTIVYQFAGETGNDPGLWLMDNNGNMLRRLTSGQDRRPIWSLDGRYLIFMRKMSAADWDLMRLDLESNQELALSAPGAQDGLPALSPGGTLVAFASDRGGNWNIYTVPLEGGEVTLLMPINGVLLNWLEHAIQWVN